MCIICDKPAGVEMPSDEDIKHMFNRNPNGAGFAVQGWFERNTKKGKEKYFDVRYQKGFMNVDDLLEALGPREKLKDKRIVIHCRITTAGNSDRPTTHPFPLSSNYGELRKTEGRGPVLFHNGAINGLGGIIDKNSSDTQDYVVGVANKLLKNPAHISKISQKIAAEIASPCRILILYPNPRHPEFRLGTWHEHDGCQYSNTGWRSEYPTKGSYYSRWDDDEWESYYSSSYSYKKPSANENDKPKDKNFDEDMWGCNHAEFAYPSKDTHWIKIKDQSRLHILETSATRVEQDEKGVKRFFYSYDTENAWVIDYSKLEMYDEQGWDMILEKRETEDEEWVQLYEENCQWFVDEAELEEWLETGTRISENEYRVKGECWLIDRKDYVAYTEYGLQMTYKTGEIGHVRQAILKDGYDSYTKKRREATLQKNKKTTNKASERKA